MVRALSLLGANFTLDLIWKKEWDSSVRPLYTRVLISVLGAPPSEPHTLPPNTIRLGIRISNSINLGEMSTDQSVPGSPSHHRYYSMAAMSYLHPLLNPNTSQHCQALAQCASAMLGTFHALLYLTQHFCTVISAYAHFALRNQVSKL